MTKRLVISILFLFIAAAPTRLLQAEPTNGTALTCSFYSSKYNGRRTASGQRFSNERLTAASKTYPFGTRLRLTNVRNGKSVEVVVNDRGPYVAGRDISVTRRAARQLGFVRAGVTQVNVEVLSK